MWSDAGLAAATVAFPFILTISFTPRSFNVAPWHHCQAVPLNFSIDPYLMMRPAGFWQPFFASIRDINVDQHFCPAGNVLSPDFEFNRRIRAKPSSVLIFCLCATLRRANNCFMSDCNWTNRGPTIYRKKWSSAQFFG
jgi:hypothetical protein